jgi:hypothetical protein
MDVRTLTATRHMRGQRQSELMNPVTLVQRLSIMVPSRTLNLCPFSHQGVPTLCTN